MLQILGTLDKPDKGKVIIDNQDITSLNQKNLASFRNKKIGFVFQFHHLLPEFTALENICIPAFIAGVPKKEAADKAMALVAIARALINNPAIILADEPSGNLDSQNAKELHELFFSLREKTGQTFVIVTHNPSLANMADRALTIVDGKIEHNN